MPFRETAAASSPSTLSARSEALAARAARKTGPYAANGQLQRSSHSVAAASFRSLARLDQRGAGTERMAQTNVSHILIRPSEIVTNEQAKTQAEAVYERFQAGEDFAALAKEFSEDPGSALNGGALGWNTTGWIEATAWRTRRFSANECTPVTPFTWSK